jgi:hypothetical protein
MVADLPMKKLRAANFVSESIWAMITYAKINTIFY